MLMVNGLTIVRQNQRVFKSPVTFELSPGQLLQVTGANGAGKTTLLRLLAGLLKPQSGSVCWQGQSIFQQSDAYASQLFFMGHTLGMNANLTVYDNLRYHACHTGMTDEAIDQALAKWGLLMHSQALVQTLSQGQCRRLQLALLTLAQKQVWILDEPLACLDVAAIDILTSAIKKHSEQNGMVIIATHQPIRLSGEQSRAIQLGELGC